MKESETKQIIEWLMTNPEFVKRFDVSRDRAEQVIDFVGTDLMERQNFIRSGSRSVLRNNYTLQVERPFLKLNEREANTDFLAGFEQWVADQSERGLIPKLGNHGRQTAWVDSQEFLDCDTDKQTGIYQLQLHIEYCILR